MSEINLSEKGHAEFAELIEQVKAKLKKVNEEVLSSVYSDIGTHIESDAWFNYREQIKRELLGKEFVYNDNSFWAREFRDKIFRENKGELVELLNRDNLQRIDELVQEIKTMEQFKYRY